MSLEDVLAGLDDIKPIHAGSLHALSKRAQEVIEFLEVVSEAASTLGAAPEMAMSLDDLEEHSDTLSRLHDLAELADDVERLARTLREVHRHRDELEWAIEER